MGENIRVIHGEISEESDAKTKQDELRIDRGPTKGASEKSIFEILKWLTSRAATE